MHCIGGNYNISLFIYKKLLSRGYDLLGNKSIAHGEYLILNYPEDKQWRYAPEIDVPRARPLIFIIPDDSINGHSVYVAGGFNINPNTHKPYMIPDLQSFNPITQRWQRLTTIPNLELSHALSFNDNNLHVSETIELPDQLPVTNILRSFDLEKLIWTNPKNDLNEQNSTQTNPVKSPLTLLPNAKRSAEIKTNQNIQVVNLI